MASSKLMASSASTSRNSDLRRKSAASSSAKFDFPTDNRLQNDANVDDATNLDANSMSVDGIVQNAYGESQENTLLNAEITLLDAAGAITPINDGEAAVKADVVPVRKKTVDEVWREIMEGKREECRRRVECKAEAMDEMMTLEDFLVKAGAVDEAAVASDGAEVKVEVGTERLSGGIFAFDSPVVVPLQSGGGSGVYVRPGMTQSVDSVGGFWNGKEVMGGAGGVGRGKRRTTSLLEPLDKATQQRHRRMIKNRESAARSRERKQAYQVELESIVVRLEEENERLLKAKAERTKERFKQLMENVIPVVQKQRPVRVLRRVRSMCYSPQAIRKNSEWRRQTTYDISNWTRPMQLPKL